MGLWWFGGPECCWPTTNLPENGKNGNAPKAMFSTAYNDD